MHFNSNRLRNGTDLPESAWRASRGSFRTSRSLSFNSGGKRNCPGDMLPERGLKVSCRAVAQRCRKSPAFSNTVPPRYGVVGTHGQIGRWVVAAFVDT